MRQPFRLIEHPSIVANKTLAIARGECIHHTCQQPQISGYLLCQAHMQAAGPEWVATFARFAVWDRMRNQ